MTKEKVYTINGFELPAECFVEMKEGTFIRLSGLMMLANYMGIPRIKTREIPNEYGEIVFEAEVKIAYYPHYLASLGIEDLTDYPFIDVLKEPVIAHGTTSPDNLKPNMARYKYVMSETRSLARALRFITGCKLAAVEELDGRTEEEVEQTLKEARKAGVTIQSALDLVEPKTLTGRVAQSKVLNDLMKNDKGAREIIKSYLNEKSVVLINNLTDDDVSALYDKCQLYLSKVQ